VQFRIPDVDQHVSVGAMFDCHVHVLVVTSVIVLYRLLFRTPRYDVVIELTPFPVTPRIDEDHVVAPVIVTGMHQNGVQRVVGRVVGILLLQVRIQRDLLVELEPVIELDRTVGDGIVLEPHQVQVQYGREGGKDDALLGILQSVLARVVLIVAV
jgi:hypothetical protein